MSPQSKLELFSAIERCGVDYVEVGFPMASQADFDVAHAIARSARSARITVLARARTADIDRAVSALDSAAATQIQLLLTGSEIHAERKRGMSVEAIIKETRDAVAYVRSSGITDIGLGYEDASRGSYDFLRRVVEAGVDAGGTTVVLPDTVGGATPQEMETLISNARTWVGDSALISVHCHNDLGLATANSLAAIKAGADVVQTTFCGIGERAGNAALEEVATVLHYKRSEYGVESIVDLRRIREVCDAVCDVIGVTPWKHKPVVGRYAFSTAAGIHASGLANDPTTYQFVEPELFGRKREMLLNRLSGRTNIRVVIEKLGMHADDAHIDRMYDMFISDSEPRRFNRKVDLTELYDAAAASLSRSG